MPGVLAKVAGQRHPSLPPSRGAGDGVPPRSRGPPARTAGTASPRGEKRTLANGRSAARASILLTPVPSARHQALRSPWPELGARRGPGSPCSVPPGDSPGSPATLTGLTLSTKPPKKRAPARRAGSSGDARAVPGTGRAPARSSAQGKSNHIPGPGTGCHGERSPLPTPGFRVTDAGNPPRPRREGRPAAPRPRRPPSSPTVILRLSSELLKFTYI